MASFDLINKIRRFYRVSENTPDIQWTRTETYRKRMEQVKTGWIISGICMLAVENVAAVVGILFFSSFMSFAFLERDKD
jgi:hypothetical protein